MKTKTPKTVDVCMMEIAPGLYRLTSVINGADYRDEGLNRGVCSIGRNRENGEILAALDERFLGNPRFECLWLR